MNGILAAALAQILLAISLVADKIFISAHGRNEPTRTHGPSAVTYVFWIGILNIFGFAIGVFGLNLPSLELLLLALAAGIAFIASLLFYYLALEHGEASQHLAIVGGFAPIATLLIGFGLSLSPLASTELIAFAFLAVGGLIMFATDSSQRPKVIGWVLLASVTTGISNILSKLVFDEAGFVTGFVLIKAGAVIASLALLIPPQFRATITHHTERAPLHHKGLYFMNRALAGVASFLILYAMSQAHPALVEAINGFRYAIIFLLVLCATLFLPRLLTERMSGKIIAAKILGTLTIILGLVGLSTYSYYASLPLPAPADMRWGVTFSPLMAEHLGLDPEEALEAIARDLRPDGVRLVAYWNRVEPGPNGWNFRELDRLTTILQNYNIPVILAIGEKTPRWPECHYPAWLDRTNTDTVHNELLEYVAYVAARYRTLPNLLYWQVENEPFLAFGECALGSEDRIAEELATIRRIDPGRHILMTDGGEFGRWYRAARLSDVFGTTLYRKVFSDTFGYVTYPISPEFYPLKWDIVRTLIGKPEQRMIDIELGMEPWTKKQIYEIPVAFQMELFPIEDFRANIAYARETRLTTHYLWGAEWWYYLKSTHDIPSYWEEARTLFAQ